MIKGSGKVKAGQVVFTSSQTWTVPRGVKKVDVFLAGGGGGSGGYYMYRDYTNGTTSFAACGGSGGCGCTANHYDVDVTPLSQIQVTVGAGGATGLNYTVHKGYDGVFVYGGTASSKYAISVGSPGGKSYFGNLNVNGGTGANPGNYSGNCGSGGPGGSGGGGGGYYSFDNIIPSGNFGTDGGSGTAGAGSASGGSGQGTSTKAFGLTQYASQGVTRTANSAMGGYSAASSGDPDTVFAENGYSGIVIVKWAEQ
jgi:hypothetical protein